MINFSFLFLIALSMRGIRNEAVFPVPVFAIPTTSLPFNIAGIDLSCIRVGLLYPLAKIFSFNFVSILKSIKLFSGIYISSI